MFGLVDLLILAAIVLYVAIHYRAGFLDLSRGLASFLGALFLSYKTYRAFSALLDPLLDVSPGLLNASSFIILFFIIQFVLRFIFGSLAGYVPFEVRNSAWLRRLGVIPALLDGLIVISLLLYIVVLLPAFPIAKEQVVESKLGSELIEKARILDPYLNEVFGALAMESLPFLSILPEEGETISLSYKAYDLSVDPVAEEEMLTLVNAERAKAGAKPLVVDPTIVTVARLHSRDMWERQYFSHDNPDGETPFDRMREGGVTYRKAGENLALARTVEQAHTGLMNSPGHKRNILDPDFGRVGIGVIDGGIYGKMFTQNFAD